MSESVKQAVEEWVKSFVIKHNLCPFAAREIDAGRVRFVVTRASDEHQLLLALHDELALLQKTDDIETTLLIHPNVLNSFDAYNQFLNLAEGLLIDQGLEGVFQIASFHPHYQFEGTERASPENYTNRSPYPVLQLLREASVETAIRIHGDIESVPIRNIQTMHQLFALDSD